MKKRFCDVHIWQDLWFRKLPCEYKSFWRFICDRCDDAGVWKVDAESAEFYIGKKIDIEIALKLFNNEPEKPRINIIPGGKWHLIYFIKFQFGILSKFCKPHIPIINLLKNHGIPIESLPEMTRSLKGGIPSLLREKVIERDGKICAYSGEALIDSEIHIDHIIPRVLGGLDRLDNLVVCSKKMNSLKSDLTLSEFCHKMNFDMGKIIKEIETRISKNSKPCSRLQEKEKEKDQEKDQEKDKEKESQISQESEILEFFNETFGKKIKMNDSRRSIIRSRLKEYTTEQLKKAIVNFSRDTWADRHKYCDIVYCMGIRNKIDNLEKWLNFEDRKELSGRQYDLEKVRQRKWDLEQERIKQEIANEDRTTPLDTSLVKEMPKLNR